MSFRERVAWTSALVVAVAVVMSSAAIYLLVRSELRGGVDDALREFVAEVDFRVDSARAEGRLTLPPQTLLAPASYAQMVRDDGAVYRPHGSSPVALPVSSATLQVATGQRPARYSDIELNGKHLRVYTARFGKGFAIQAARSAEDVDAALRRAGFALFVIGFMGVALAVVLGRVIARSALRPIAELTDAAEAITRTRDLSRRIEPGERGDELSRLSESFNEMLSALEESQRAQRRLVADASHELRTPLTSMRTNVELLARGEQLGPGERDRMVGGVVAQIEELTVIVGDLVDLARGDVPGAVEEDLRFDELVAAAVDRSRRLRPDLAIDVRLEPCVVRGDAERLMRAVSNLLDNAGKWSPPGKPVELALSVSGELTVRDHGPGIAPEDLPHVFDRFYRAPASRGMPGSGLGLAIVRHVAESHGGEARAANAPDGGALMTLAIPAATVPSQP